MTTATVFSDERGANMRYFVANDVAALLYLTNLGCIDHNPWSSDADHQDQPDFVFFDLDPTPRTPFSAVLEVAGKIYAVLDSIGLRAFLKTSGATGFHIYVPLERRYTYAQAAQFAGVIARVVAAELPRLTTLERSISKRPPGRVLIDVHQNARGKPLAAVYSVRATPEASVSAPVTPAELARGFGKPREFTMENIEERI
ncbi:MAG TPA: hypothetical protein VGQ11_11635, partial [Candidatus Acidoferrales bacterium]|nr:hypothetical protein [Candidatus Acidoferrales bacterium]